MRTPVLMPRLDNEMTHASVAAWLRAPGDAVRRGEPIAEIETEKATVEIDAPIDGVLDEVLELAGTQVPVGAVIAYVRAPDG